MSESPAAAAPAASKSNEAQLPARGDVQPANAELQKAQSDAVAAEVKRCMDLIKSAADETLAAGKREGMSVPQVHDTFWVKVRHTVRR